MNMLLPAAYSFIEDILQVLYIKRSQRLDGEKSIWFWNIADKDRWISYFSLDLFAKPYLLDFNDRS